MTESITGFQAQDLRSHAGGQFSLGPLSFSVPYSKHLGIIGLSGSGKSTLLRTLALFIMPDGGTIRTPWTQFTFDVDGMKLVEDQVVAHRRHIAYVGQSTSLWPHLNIEQNIDLGLRHVLRLNPAERRERIEQVLSILELSHLAKRKTWDISGGEARRAAIARAIVLRPRVILLDEPDTGLDPVRSRTQIDLILNVCKEAKATAIVVSHNPAVIEQCADDILVLDNGRAVEMGPTHQILNHPENEATCLLVQSAGWLKHQSSARNNISIGG